MFLRVRPSSCPHAARRPARYAHRAPRWGCPARRYAISARLYGRRYAVAARLYCSSSVSRITYVYLHDFSNERSKGAAGSPAAAASCEFQHRATASGEFQHRFGRRPRRRVGIDRVAIASSAWRKLCSSSLVETVVGVSDASSNLATAVATHSISVAMSFMARPGAGSLRGRN